jgi:hypothetical protein
MTNPEIKYKKTFQIRLSKFELLHLRDLMSVALPPEGSQTVSNSLAVAENRQLIENGLWKKISEACVNVGLPVGDDAPDYVIAPSGMTPLGVFQISSDPYAKTSSEDEDDDEDDSEESVLSDLFKGKA